MSLNNDKFRSTVRESPAVKRIAKGRSSLPQYNIAIGIAIAEDIL
jgi:hypothetical protein